MNNRTRLAVITLVAGLAFAPRPMCAQDRPVAVIDAGHGGSQNGVVHEGWLEKDLVLEIAFVVGAEFVRAGWDVVFTRTADVDVEWPQRRQRAEAAAADLLIMLHAMGGDPTEHGSEIYFDADRPRSVALAQNIGRLMEEAGSPARGAPRRGLPVVGGGHRDDRDRTYGQSVGSAPAAQLRLPPRAGKAIGGRR